MCGRTGLNTVGSCERATTTCPPFLRLSAASTTPRSSRGPSTSAALAPPKRPRAARRESSRRETSDGMRVMGFLLARLCWPLESLSTPPKQPSPPQGERGSLRVEGLAALVAVPQANEMALALRLVGVAERRPAVGEEPVVQILEL